MPVAATQDTKIGTMSLHCIRKVNFSGRRSGETKEERERETKLCQTRDCQCKRQAGESEEQRLSMQAAG